MAAAKKIIITCASTGASMTPSMSPYLPITPQQIAEQSIEGVKAGAAIVHLHARSPVDGRPSNVTADWDAFISPIKASCDAIINMSASLGATAESRLEAVLALRPEIATVIVGSMNYGNFKKAREQGFSEADVAGFKHQWEKDSFGPGSYDVVTSNSFKTIDAMIAMLTDAGIAMEFEIYDVGHLTVLEHHLNRRKVGGKIIVQFLTGILGGITSDIDHLLHLKNTAERMFGDQLVLFTHGTGMRNIRTATFGGMMGTHIRIGQEDNLFDRPGKPFKSNAEQVAKIKHIFDELNIDTATPAEARAMLGIPAK
ncbi:3-keto-5-aminohexanoate cleavage protein [Acidisphaera sp. L21]|uniref:3-keto-5-aminohexanoate cleavage protein n=1 Tax=Acidisphaera sp. L21 TaxID=1641851 RepID=UPI00131C4E84|nr:3-keto-5-aminohexanoate cleavage protein [Acidisphaera sp. L21]